MMDLQQHLKTELLTNPFLELLEPEEEEQEKQETTQEQEKEKQEKEQEIDWEEILLNGFDVGGVKPQYEEQEYLEPVCVETPDLIDHLREQLQLMSLSPRQQLLAEEFLGNITDDGYLSASLEEVQGSVNSLLESHTGGGEEAEADDLDAPAPNQDIPFYTIEEVEAMLAIVQRLDPPGVGARDLRECLLLQLAEAGDKDALAYRLVAEAFPDLIAHRWNDLAKRFGVEPQKVQAAGDSLARFDPKPGLKYSNKSDGYIIPDLVVDKVDGKYHVSLNDTGMPRLRLSRSYQDVARDKKQLTQENREFIAQKMNSANWMIQAIEQRRQTMLKVMNFIVDRQRAFFEKGVEFLKPLTLREVAEVISMHESTVSRVTNEKYVQTPRGVLPLKFFFSSALSTASGEDASARSIRAKLQKMVGEEDPAKPLTDQQIVHLFKEQGIQIARRTVAKYRDQLGILPARMRKRV
jgi:RNA polymerase sigma-54 factor